MNTAQVARWIIGFAWIYHGVVIKLINIAPIEYYLSSQIGLSEIGTYWFIKAAGVGEVAFGLAFIYFYKFKQIVYANIVFMVSLIVMVAFMDANYLIEGFNPVTTNIPIIGLSLILLNEINNNQLAKS